VVTGSKNIEVLHGVKYVYEPLLVRREKLTLWLNPPHLMKAERFRDLLHRRNIVYVSLYALLLLAVALLAIKSSLEWFCICITIKS